MTRLRMPLLVAALLVAGATARGAAQPAPAPAAAAAPVVLPHIALSADVLKGLTRRTVSMNGERGDIALVDVLAAPPQTP
jgi:hypothetical protein